MVKRQHLHHDHGEKIQDLHHAVVKRQHLHHAVVKIQIYIMPW